MEQRNCILHFDLLLLLLLLMLLQSADHLFHILLLRHQPAELL